MIPSPPPFTLDPAYADATDGQALTLRTVYDDREPDVNFNLGCATLAIIPLLLFAAVTLAQISGGLALAARFDAEGIATWATPRRCDTVVLFFSDLGTRLWYSYDVVVEGAAREVTTSAMGVSDRLCAPPSGRLRVQYLPAEPAQSRIIDPLHTRQAVPPAQVAQIVIALLLAGIVARWAWRERGGLAAARERYRLLRTQGRILPGEIVSAHHKAVGRSENAVYIEYAFNSPTGARLTGRQRKLRLDLRSQFPPAAGTPIRVLYAADDAYVAL